MQSMKSMKLVSALYGNLSSKIHLDTFASFHVLELLQDAKRELGLCL